MRPPHDKVYGAYLGAMVDFANGEYQKYENAMQLYNAYLAEFARWFIARYCPADGERAPEGAYVSAYGIAVKHGFPGTEEDWLASLQGGQGAPGPQVSAASQARRATLARFTRRPSRPRACLVGKTIAALQTRRR